jgi:hypothetical protein
VSGMWEILSFMVQSAMAPYIATGRNRTMESEKISSEVVIAGNIVLSLDGEHNLLWYKHASIT